MKRMAPLILIVAVVSFQWKDAPGLESLVKEKRVAAKARLISERGGDMFGFSNEISAMLENSCGIKCRVPADDFFDEIDRSDEQAEHIDPFSIFSGGIPVRKALRLETVSYESSVKGTIDPASLSSPATWKLPYTSMLSGRKNSIYSIDRYTPADFYYLHVSDAGELSEIISYIENTAGALRRRISPVSVDYMTRDRVVTQLALKEGEALNRFYSAAIVEMVITGSDPFISEGSDITIVIKPANVQLLSDKLNEIRRGYRSAFRCKESQVNIAGINASLLESDGRRVYSLMCTLPDSTIIISNSLKGAETVINTSKGMHPSLAEEPDYLYARSLFPASAGGEDAFFYMSDLFVRHLSSPVLKITEARRLKEMMRMSVLEKYAMYYYLLNGRKSSSVEEITASAGTASLNDSRKKELAAIKKNPAYKRALALDKTAVSAWPRFESALRIQGGKKKSKKRKSDSGETLANAMKVFYRNMTGSSARAPEDVLSLIETCGKNGSGNSARFSGVNIADGTFTASSDLYGMTGLMVPCIDLQGVMITESEADDYREFSANFNSSGEAYISPAALKLTLNRGLPGVSAEAFVFSTGNNPLFSLLSAFVGGGPVRLNPDTAVAGDVFSLAVKPDHEALDRYLFINGIRLTGKNGREISMKNLISGEVQMHINDSLPPAGFDSSALRRMLNKGGYGSNDAASGFVIWTLLHPVRLAIPVKDSSDASSAIESAIRQLAEKWNSGNLVKCDTFSFDDSGTGIRVLRLTMLGSLTARIFTAVKDGTLHIATTEKYIKSALHTQKPVNSIGINGNAVMVIRPSVLSQEREIYRSEIIEDSMLKSMKNFGTIKLASLIYPGAKVNELPDLICRDFGFKPVCPLGGEYLIEKQSGEVYSSLFGSYTSPLLRTGEAEDGPVYEGMKKFFSTSEIRCELEFATDGIKIRFSTK